jgi:hypothetical protein
MRGLLPRDAHSLGRKIRRLDRAAGALNPYLLALAIGLASVYFSCVLTLLIVGIRETSASPAAIGAPCLSRGAPAPAEGSR